MVKAAVKKKFTPSVIDPIIAGYSYHFSINTIVLITMKTNIVFSKYLCYEI